MIFILIAFLPSLQDVGLFDYPAASRRGGGYSAEQHCGGIRAVQILLLKS